MNVFGSISEIMLSPIKMFVILSLLGHHNMGFLGYSTLKNGLKKRYKFIFKQTFFAAEFSLIAQFSISTVPSVTHFFCPKDYLI